MPDLANQFENLVTVYEKPDEKAKLARLFDDAASAENVRSRNILNSERWFKKRFGVRPSVVTWPWRNAANLHMPLVDKTIRRAKPAFANMIGTNYPTVMLESNFHGDDQSLVRGIERRFHEMLFDEDKMNVFLDLCWGIDMMLERGRFITKVIQEFTPVVRTEEITIANLSPEMREFLIAPTTTDEQLALELISRYKIDLDDESQVAQVRSAIKQFRAGKPVVRFERKLNTTPFPTLCVRDPNTVLFPSNTTFVISRAEWVRDRVTLDLNAVESRVESGTWDKTNGRLLLDRLTNERSGRGAQPTTLPASGPLEQELAREGIAQTGTATPQFDEYYIWKRMPGKTLAERMVLTVHPRHPDLPLRLIRYPYTLPDGRPEEWPFDQVMFEIVSERAYAPRGYPQILDSLQTELTNNHNAKQNWMTIANNLNFKAKRNSGVSTQFIPGQPLWVNRMDDAQEINIGQRDLSFDNEERILKQWAEEYIGILDQTLTNISGQPERRTKAEIDAVSALQAQVASLDVRVFQACMQRVYRKVWNRWMQYGPDDIELQMSDGSVRTVRKADVRERLKLRTTGDVFSTNRQLKAARMQNVFATLRGDPRADQDRLYRAWLTLEDERLAEDVLLSGQQIQQEQVERFVADVDRINKGYTVIPRPSDDNRIALEVVRDFLNDPKKRRNFHPDRLEALRNFYAAHELAAQKKGQATSRGGRMMQEVAATAQGATGREARQ